MPVKEDKNQESIMSWKKEGVIVSNIAYRSNEKRPEKWLVSLATLESTGVKGNFGRVMVVKAWLGGPKR